LCHSATLPLCHFFHCHLSVSRYAFVRKLPSLPPLPLASPSFPANIQIAKAEGASHGHPARLRPQRCLLARPRRPVQHLRIRLPPDTVNTTIPSASNGSGKTSSPAAPSPSSRAPPAAPSPTSPSKSPPDSPAPNPCPSKAASPAPNQSTTSPQSPSRPLSPPLRRCLAPSLRRFLP